MRGQDRFALQYGSDLGFTVETKTAPTKLEKTAAFVAQQNAARFAAILEDKNKSIELYRIHAFQPGEKDGLTQEERLIALRSHIENIREQSYARLNQLLLDEFNALGIQFEQATWDDKKNDTGKPEKRRLKLSDIEALHPFHWGYEFDKVMASGGFDGIITNPPWEIFKPQSKEFFDGHSALVSKNKMSIKDFEKEQARLLKNADIREAWLEFLSRFPHVSTYFRSAAQFKNQIAIINGKKAGTDINFYKLFLEQCFNLLHDGGNCGILVPTSIYSDLGAKQLRELLFGSGRVEAMFGLSNERFVFEGVDHRFKVCLLAFSKGGATEKFTAAFRMHPYEAVTPDGLDAFFHDSNGHVQISTALVRQLSPESVSVPEFRSDTDIAISRKIFAWPFLGSHVEGRWQLALTNELHMTNDSDLFVTSPGSGRLPLFEGKMIHQFTCGWAEPKYWVSESKGRTRLGATSASDETKLNYQDYRLAFREIARNTDERTLIATLLPRNVFANHKLMISNRERFQFTVADMLYLCAVLNSFVLDYSVRPRVNTSISMFTFYQLPVPRLAAADPAFAPIVKRAAQLICTTPEFDTLAKEVSTALKLPAAAVKGVTDPAARAQLRAEMDALIAHLYGLTKSEFAHILTTFPLVDESVKQQTLNTYRDLLRLGQLPDTRL